MNTLQNNSPSALNGAKEEIIIQNGETRQIFKIIDSSFNSLSKTQFESKFILQPNSNLEFIFLFSNNFKGDYFEDIIFELQENSSVVANYCFFSQNTNFIKFNRENIILQNAKFIQNTLFFAKDNSVLEFKEYHKFIKPNSFGKFRANGFLKDYSKSSYNAIIDIEPMSKNVDSRLDMHSTILGSRASSIMIPSLQIKSNDVKAGHGATVSNIDEDNLFYMRTRGLSKEQSINIFIDGLFNEFIQNIGFKDARDLIQNEFYKFN